MDAAIAASAAVALPYSSRISSLQLPSNPLSSIFPRKSPLLQNPIHITLAQNPPSTPNKTSSLTQFFTSVDDEDEIDKSREECDVVGIHGDPESTRLCYLALHALQHRGQEGARIISVQNGVGLMSEIFDGTKLDQLSGNTAIGHVRYSTSRSSMLKNVQSLVSGSVGVAHNGNFINYQALRAELEDKGSIFTTTSDTEVVLHLIAALKARLFFLRIVEACERLVRAYSMVFVTEDKLVVVWDPYGFRLLEPKSKMSCTPQTKLQTKSMPPHLVVARLIYL